LANIIKLPQNAWYEPREQEFPLPDSWEVSVHNIAGYAEPPMTPGEIRAAIASPVGMPPLREMAKNKKEVVIIFDDMTRSTQVAAIVPFILEELAEAGIADDQIRFIAAVANHQGMDRISMVKKLGENVLARFTVYNHCPFINCTHIGTSSSGTRASINSEVMHCDLKISLGTVMPHVAYGFSGGGKIIMPGVASYDTVAVSHGRSHKERRDKQKKPRFSYMGVIDENPANIEAQEIARMVGLDMTVNCIANMWGETVAIFAGALEPAYRAAVEKAKSHYLVTSPRDSDIVIANTYVKASEFAIAWASAQPAVTSKGGDAVIITNSPPGQVVHYLLDRFGKTIGGKVHRMYPMPPHINNLIIYSEYPELRILDLFPDRDRVRLMSDWSQVIQALQKWHGNSPKVAVYPSADMQFFAD